MSHKISQARRGAFLAALAATGNQTLAAEQARVSRSWVQLQRSTDAGFDAAVRGAIEEAKAGLRALRDAPSTSSVAPQDERGWGCRPGRGWQFVGGVELVVRGTGGSILGPRPAGGRRVQVARARPRQWSPRAEARFLAALMATCNVKAACAEVGLTPASAYNHRKRWPAFARRWAEAVRVGYDQIELALIEAAGNFLSGEPPAEPPPLRGMTVDHALHLLHMHQREVRGVGKRPGRVRQPGDIEEVRAEVVRRLGVLERVAGREGRS